MEDQLRELFENTDLFYREIGERLGISKKMVLSRLHKMYTPEQIHTRAKKSWSRAKLEGNNWMRGIDPTQHPKYIGGVVGDGNGYLMVTKPDWYTGRKGSRYVFQHNLILCEALGLAELPAGFVVHHIDFNKQNNTLGNLALMTISAHSKLHQMLERATTIPQGSRAS